MSDQTFFHKFIRGNMDESPQSLNKLILEIEIMFRSNHLNNLVM